MSNVPLEEALKSLGLEELEARMDGRGADGSVSAERTVQEYLAWLNGRLLNISLSNEAEMKVEMVAWCRSLHARGVARDSVISALRDWRATYTEDAVSAQRLEVAENGVMMWYQPPSPQDVAGASQRQDRDAMSVISIPSSNVSPSSSVEFVGMGHGQSREQPIVVDTDDEKKDSPTWLAATSPKDASSDNDQKNKGWQHKLADHDRKNKEREHQPAVNSSYVCHRCNVPGKKEAVAFPARVQAVNHPFGN